MGVFGYVSSFRKSNLWNLFMRTLQLVDALVIIGMYAVDLNHAAKQDKYSDGKWVSSCPSTSLDSGQDCFSLPPETSRLISAVKVFAVTVGSLAAVTALLFSLTSIFLQYRAVALLFLWDWVLTILFAALSGIFGVMYLDEKVEMDGGVKRMKTAVAFDIIGLVLWFLSAMAGTWWFFTEKSNSRHTAKG